MSGRDIEGFQLSPQQERLWRLSGDRFDPAYSTSFALSIDGALQPDALRDALNDVVRRHEILRTTFRRLPGRSLPVQVINGDGRLAWQQRDLRGLAEPDRDAALDAAVSELRGGAIDVESGPVLEACLLSLAPTRHRLLLRMPSLNADASSAPALVEELSRAYAGRTGGAPSGDETEPMQYADLAEWQQEMIGGDDGETARSFWQKQLEEPVLPSWPATHGLSADDAFRPSSHVLAVPADGRDETLALAAASGAAPEAVLFAAWQALVHRQSGQREFVLGATRNGRGFEELRGALGSFSKLLPLSCRVEPGDPFVRLVERAGRCLAEAGETQEYFKWPDGDASRADACLPVAFEFRSGAASGAGGDVRFHVCDTPDSVTSFVDRFAIMLSCHDDGERLLLALHHDASRVRSDEAAHVGGRLAALLASAARRPEAAVAELDILGEQERRLIVDEFSGRNTLASDDAAPVLVHEAIARRAAVDGDLVAVAFEDERLAYAELDARAERIAARLRRLGVGPDTIVGLCCVRSPRLAVGILSILKAGGAYLPLDPSYPPERLEFMLSDSAAPVLLVEKELAKKLTAHSARVVLLDDENDGAKDDPAPADAAAPSGDHLAYVIYTSGSTGTPKGVAVTHANLAASTNARGEHYGEPVGSYLLPSSFSFDSSVAGIFWTLTDGGTLVIPKDGDERDPGSLAGLVERHRATHLLALPSVVGLLLPHARRLASLETVIVAGEECPAELVESFRAAVPGARLFNEYGPTEATVWCTVHDLLSETAAAPVPIGRPIEGASVYVLDEGGAPAPIGVTGELHVGGRGVTRGYLGSDELTAEKFVPDPFAGRPGARLYRTGDLARFRPDGVLEFLGRVDEQVKIRGYRIEIGEVEDALRGHADVEQAVVVAREDTPGAKRLVGYVVASGSRVPGSDELREHVGGKLPPYMVPPVYVVLDALPLMPNGKVDRSALPSPEDAAGPAAGEGAVPSSALERLIADTWCEVLKRDEIGVDDDFFELGGNSIQAAVLMNKLQTALGEFLHVATLFRFPKISQLAEHLQAEHADAVARALGGGSGGTAKAGEGEDEDKGEPGPPEPENVDDMSDEEVRSILERMLNEEEGDG